MPETPENPENHPTSGAEFPVPPAKGRPEPYNRFEDALFVQAGACNPIALANLLARRVREAMDEGGGTDAGRQDPACRLIAHQIGHLFGLWEIDHGDGSVYARLQKECADKSRPETVKMCVPYLARDVTAG